MATRVQSPEIGTAAHSILRFRSEQWEACEDLLAVEAPLDMRLQITGQPARSVSLTMRTPGQDADLVRGYLFTEGILRSPSDIVAIEATEADRSITAVLRPETPISWAHLERHGYTSSSCGVCGKTSLEEIHVDSPFERTETAWRVPNQYLRRLPERLREAQQLFARTGGIHGAGLFDLNGQLVAHREDVGRHNALDKLLGHAFAAGWLPLDRHLLLLSGRASFELIQKAAVAGIRLVAAVGAPSSLAVATAQRADMTLIGFAGRDRLNVYCGSERLTEIRLTNYSN